MPETLGRYRLIRKLAQGGMGNVWLAREQGHDGVVVVKTLLPHLKDDHDFVNMFFDEARIAAALSHPNVAQIYDIGEHDGEYFMVMEYVDGCSLHTVMQQETRLPRTLALYVASQAAGALQAAHEAKNAKGRPLGIIHRDVSPPNVLLGFDGSVKLIDFGIARAANKLVRTAGGVIKGKFAYLSPEQAYGQALDARSDVFALGIVLWEMLTHRRLFKRATDTETMHAVVGAEIAAPSKLVAGLPKSVDAIVMRALNRELNQRFASAHELKQALDSVLGSTSPEPLSAFMRANFEQEEVQLAAKRVTATVVALNTSETAPQLEPVGASLSRLDAAELASRIASLGAADQIRGLVFNATLLAVLRAAGAASEASVRQARSWVDALDYPAADFLRVLWAAANVLAPRFDSANAALEFIGATVMQVLIDSSAKSAFEVTSFLSALTTLIDLLDALVGAGTRVISLPAPRLALVSFKSEVLPLPFYAGLFRELASNRFDRRLTTSCERVGGERFEMRLTW